jgi:hypothetical protein
MGDIMLPMVHSQSDKNNPYYGKLKELLAQADSDKKLFETIVNAPFHDRRETTFLGLGILVFMIVNERTGMIDRIALSETEFAAGAVEHSAKPFKEIKIPVDNKDNIIAKAIRENKPQLSADWSLFFVPALAPKDARFNQAGAGIGCSIVYPLQGGEIKGAITYSFYLYPDDIEVKQQSFMRDYSNMVSDELKKLSKIKLD